MSYDPVKYDFDVFKKKVLSDAATQKKYMSLEDEFALITEMVRARKKANKTQKEIAEIMKTSSSVISRLESIDGQKKHSPTLATLQKYAKAVGCRLDIKFVSESNCRHA
ncbi:MAG: helix-turn-helix transcriptional regulator [Gammaproteobacteria bacterium]|nr:helix-turn-helix transcriptional regulator [Gammaproteobacteria bacterium]